jgi:hypothetical protein
MSDGNVEPKELSMSLDQIIAMRQRGSKAGNKRKSEETVDDKEARKERALNMSLDAIIKEKGVTSEQRPQRQQRDGIQGGQGLMTKHQSNAFQPNQNFPRNTGQRLFKAEYEWSNNDETFVVKMYGVEVIRVLSSGKVRIDISCRKSFGSFTAINTILRTVGLVLTFEDNVSEGEWSVGMQSSSWTKTLSSGPM